MKVFNINHKFADPNKISFKSYDDNCRDFIPVFLNNNSRTIVFYLGDITNSNYISIVFKIILKLAKVWYVFPRTSFNNLTFSGKSFQNYILSFNHKDFDNLAISLFGYINHLQGVGDDIFLINQENDIIVSISHHLNEEGISVEFTNKTKCVRLFNHFNDISCQLEFYSSIKTNS